MISLTMSREDWRTGSIPELPLLRMQNFKTQKGASMATAITDLRKLNRLSQSQLAEKAGLTQKTIGNYEKDISFIRNAQYKNIEKVAKALGVSVDIIFLEDTSVFLKQINQQNTKVS